MLMFQLSNNRFFYSGLYSMAALYMVAGIIHIINPDFYLHIMPLWLPWHILLVFVSGVAEIILGLLLLIPKTRRFSAWLIILMLGIFFFTIHIPMAVDYYQTGNRFTWVAMFRLSLQFVFIGWAYLYAKK